MFSFRRIGALHRLFSKKGRLRSLASFLGSPALHHSLDPSFCLLFADMILLQQSWFPIPWFADGEYFSSIYKESLVSAVDVVSFFSPPAPKGTLAF